MMQLDNDYKREDFLKFLEEDFLIDFKREIRPVNIGGLSSIHKANYLGESKGLDLQVFEFSFEGSPNKRVALTKDAFSVMRSSAIYNALAVFHSPDKKDWRFSLMTATPEPTEKGKVSLSYSNPKRLSFFLGPNAKINTPTKFLIKKGKTVDFEDLKSRFSIEVVNKEFYKEISQAFIRLVGGTLSSGRSKQTFKPLLKLPAVTSTNKASLEFAVRLIGRIIFCWFLREKKSEAGLSLMPKELISINAAQVNKDFYHKILEPIFFEILNKPVKSRHEDFAKDPFSSVPYLNGGLFSPQADDFYRRMNGDFQSQFHNTLIIPDSWLYDFFGILETYNFTIDENTSYDEELSIDPEMLGRIFENLLAEINPETGESARKSTGSYYTPRTIVNYMVDESLLRYLKEETGIKEEKLRAIISYDLSDDSENPITFEQKERIIEALEKVKILDPACGSGAFPIGALQKIVFILQQTDPDGSIWKKQQLSKADPEFRRDIENRFSKNEIDFLRKLSIVRKSIFGIDIQPIATEISRLRCFLTLIVDESINDKEENRGIKPLPNLDFKFVSANSLIGLPKKDLSQESMFDDYQKIDNLKNIRDQYFNADGIEREQLKTEFVMQQKQLVDQLIREHGFMGLTKAELTQKLTDWEPFMHRSSSWFDTEWMFGIKDGFDIVIANPPYIRVHKQSSSEKEYLRKNYASPYKDFDIYIVFIELGLNLLKPNGVLSFITPDKYLVRDYGKNIRNLILQYQIIEFYDVSRATDLFGAAVYPLLTLIQNKKINSKTRIKITDSIRNMNSPTTDYALDQETWSKKGLIELIQESDLKILNRVYEGTVSLGSIFGVDIFCGTPRAVDYYKWTDGLLEVKKEDAIKVLVCANLKPYFINHTIRVRTLGKIIRSPYFTNSNALISKSRWNDFLESPKILIRGNDTRITAVLDETPSVFIGIYGIKFNRPATINLMKYLLALLNSKFYQWVFCKQNPSIKIGGDYFSINSSHLERLPFLNPSQEQADRINELVDSINLLTKSADYLLNPDKQNDFAEFNKQVDLAVYKIFGLTTEEVGIIENFFA